MRPPGVLDLDEAHSAVGDASLALETGPGLTSTSKGGESGVDWEKRHWHSRPAEGTEPSVLHNEWQKAGLGAVPEGAVCLSSSQILAYGKAAVRLERSASARHERSVFKRELFLSLFVFFWCSPSLYLFCFSLCFFCECSQVLWLDVVVLLQDWMN